jgi:hypothetical protein
LPEENIDDYIWSQLDLQNMPADEDLINFLEDTIDKHLKRKKTSFDVTANNPLIKLSAVNLVELPGLKDIEISRKEMIRRKFQEILDRPN